MSVRNMELTWKEQLKGQEQYWNSILQTRATFPFFNCLCWIMMIQISITSTKAWALSKIAQGCESQRGGGCGENGNWDTHTQAHTHTNTRTHTDTRTHTHAYTHTYTSTHYRSSFSKSHPQYSTNPLHPPFTLPQAIIKQGLPWGEPY